MLTATIRACEESILPVQSDRADRALHHIGINFDTSVVKKTRDANASFPHFKDADVVIIADND